MNRRQFLGTLTSSLAGLLLSSSLGSAAAESMIQTSKENAPQDAEYAANNYKAVKGDEYLDSIVDSLRDSRDLVYKYRPIDISKVPDEYKFLKKWISRVDDAVKEYSGSEWAKQIGKCSYGIVIFSAPNCPPCRGMKTILDGLKDDYPGLTVVKTETTNDEMKSLDIQCFPTTLFFENGYCVGSVQGLADRVSLSRDGISQKDWVQAYIRGYFPKLDKKHSF